MEKFVEKFIFGLGVVILIGLLAVVSGTIVYFLWPIAIPAVLPGLVTAGTIAGQLTWWQSVCLTWICSILLKSSSTHSKS